MNGNRIMLGNHPGEITFNVVRGVTGFYGYEMKGVLKFATVEDAMEYVDGVGACEGDINLGQEYYAITKQDGCSFNSIGFYRGPIASFSGVRDAMLSLAEIGESLNLSEYTARLERTYNDGLIDQKDFEGLVQEASFWAQRVTV